MLSSHISAVFPFPDPARNAERDLNLTNVEAAANILLVFLCISAAVTDAVWKKIFNTQTYAGMLCGLALGYLGGGWQGLLLSFLGMLAGCGLLFLFYLTGGMGGGDVKFLGAIGALKGAAFVVWTMCYAGLIGGIMALSLIIWRGHFKKTMLSMVRLVRHPRQSLCEEDSMDAECLPYGVAISLGCMWALFSF